jgi:hypothetical protein
MIKNRYQVSSIRYQAFLSSVFCLLFSVTGCGYYTHSVYRGPYKTICVEPFANKVDIISEDATSLSQRFRTYHPFMETDLRTAVINRFMFDGGLRIVAKEEADLVLKGELIDYQRDALRYENNQEDVAEYRISLVMRLTLFKRGEEKPLWDEPRFIGDTTYFTSGAQAKSEQAALDVAISDLARRVVERTVENW